MIIGSSITSIFVKVAQQAYRLSRRFDTYSNCSN